MNTPGVTAARAATTEIEDLLQPAIRRLQCTLGVTESTGVFADADLMLAAITGLKRSLDQAEHLARRTDWPLSITARRKIITSLSAGIVQLKNTGATPSETAASWRSPAPPSDGGAA